MFIKTQWLYSKIQKGYETVRMEDSRIFKPQSK